MRTIHAIAGAALLLGAVPVWASESSQDPGQRASDEAGAAAKDYGKSIDDSFVTAKIKTKLMADSLVKTNQIDVTTKNHVVRLSGVVSSEAERDRALDIAADTDGVTRVENKIKIEQPMPSTDETPRAPIR